MTVISNDGRFEWDSGKNELNKKKHLLSFEEILEVFDDPAFLEIADTDTCHKHRCQHKDNHQLTIFAILFVPISLYRRCHCRKQKNY